MLSSAQRDWQPSVKEDLFKLTLKEKGKYYIKTVNSNNFFSSSDCL